MKQKFFSFLLTALLGVFGMNAWAQDYEISSAQDLADFAEAVNGGEFEANAILTADIDMSELTDWTAIGDWGGISGTASACYKGHFDGQGHTIKNFNFTSTHNYYGIFGVVSTGCLIENLIVKGTITTNIATAGVVGYARDATPTLRNIHSYLKINNTRAGSRLGGILGTAHNGTIVVDRCTYSGTLDGNDSGGSGNYGGIVGYENNNSGAHLRVTNCLFDGELKNSAATPGTCTFGGMVGYVGASPDVTITNCLSVGTVQSAVTGQFYGAVKHNTCSIINSFYQGDNINGSSSTVTPTTQEVTKVTDQQLASGEICFWLNESVSGGTNWFQTLNDDGYPFPYNGDVHDPIYANGSFICDGVTPKEGSTVVYSNTNSSIVDPHNFVNGFCSVCGALDATYMTANADGIFEIGTPAQLKWFAVYVNQVNPAVDAILTANIDLSSVEWTPIGKGVYYGGTFDGQGFTVSNLTYVGSGDCNGLFGGVKDATVKNFSINGSLVCAGSWTGAIGRAENATISNVHSALTIETPTPGVFHHAGGVVGGSYNPTTVDRCSFSGTLTVNEESHDCFGGIMGYTTEYCTVKNCINYGTISFAKDNCYAGGIIGYINSAACNGTHNCLNIGTVEYTGEGDATYSGAIVGRLRGNNPALWGYSYYLAGSAVNASGENQIPTNYEVTAAQLANGEAAAKLAPYIRQNIGTDATPVLDPTHNVVAEITAAGYATLYVPDTDVKVPTGVTAYTGEFATNPNNGIQHLALNEVGSIIPAQTAVVLNGAEGIYEFAISVPVPDGALGVYDDEVDGNEALVKGWAAPFADNVLKGTADDIEAAGKYILAQPAGEPVCFYLAESGIIKAGKAYLEVPEGTDVKAFYFSFGDEDPTGISTIDNAQLTIDSKIYNLAGQRVSKMQKGINIVNGKKVLF
jgi:hypothetical protein